MEWGERRGVVGDVSNLQLAEGGGVLAEVEHPFGRRLGRSGICGGPKGAVKWCAGGMHVVSGVELSRWWGHPFLGGRG